jgi:hypothetical protein
LLWLGIPRLCWIKVERVDIRFCLFKLENCSGLKQKQ